MFKALSLVYALALTLSLATFTAAAPLQTRGSTVILGWKGLQAGDKFKPMVSGGGELGKVLYIADGTDLALSFAKTGTHVCIIYADATAWGSISKSWVSQNDLATHKGTMETLYPGAVLFASHTAAGLSATATDHEPWQMGIRQGDLTRLGVYGDCYPKTDAKVKAGQKLDYKHQSANWHIQKTPERGP